MNFSQSIEDYLTSNNTSNCHNIKNKIYENNSNKIVKIIEEKNKLIEEYQKTIKNKEKKNKEEIDKLIKENEEYLKENINLKNKFSSIKNNNINGLIDYYEKEIGKIILTYDKMLEQYKNNISILMNKNKENNHYENLKKIIEILMNENRELKEKNEKLQKNNRLNYNNNKINISEKNQDKKDNNNKNNQLNYLLIENKKLKEEIEEDKKIILNLSNSFEFLKKNNNKNNIFKSPIKKNIINSKKKFISIFENEIEIDKELDKYLNSCQVLINDKINFINSIINKILVKVEKENSIYKKIYIKYFNEINEALNILCSENKILIKKSNNSFNSTKFSFQILNNILNEYNSNYKNKQVKILSDQIIEMVKNFLNLFN